VASLGAESLVGVGSGRAADRIAATVWASVDRLPYFAAPRDVISVIAGKKALTSWYQVAFRCAAARLAEAFRRVGLRDV
jgi:hypothetical protein